MEDIEKIDIESEEAKSDDFITKLAFDNFGIKYLYPWQRLVIANILEAYDYKKGKSVDLEENNEEDDSFTKGRQIILLPTGAGKSLCFQMPALVLDGPSLIIYPLLALMTDQQRRMEEGSLGCVVFRGGQDEAERNMCFQKIKEGAKIILANPEVLQSKSLLEKLKTVGIKHIAIDEAHCVSEWGDSFRPSYLELGNVIKELNPPVISAFTATASPSVLSRISEILFDGEAHIVRSESDRKNIHYFVRPAIAKKKEVLRLVKSELRPMIVFCGTRDKAEDMAQEINVCYGRGTAKFYHAGLEKSEKTDIEKWFYESKDGVLCATCAYGMGVDKKDIKTVVHLEVPATAEAYIQEAGRGGRDGSVANAILLWSLEDSLKYSKYEKGTRESAMREFAETTDCRRQVLLDALGGEQAVCSGCDLCNKRKEIKEIAAIYDKNLFQKRKKLKNFQKSQYVSDWEETYSSIKKKKNYYSEEDIESEIFEKMNEKDRKNIGVNIWTHGDSVDVIEQLKNYGKIKTRKLGWKGKLAVNSSQKD